MSLLEEFRYGWSFRSSRPEFERGQELSAFVTGYDGSDAIVRIGDTTLRIPDAPSGLLDRRVRLRVTDFDGTEHDGEAEYVETVGEGAF